MKVVRFASAPDGGSQFVEVDMPIDNASTDGFGNTVHRSTVLPAQSTMVTEMPEGFYRDWHRLRGVSCSSCFPARLRSKPATEKAPLRQR